MNRLRLKYAAELIMGQSPASDDYNVEGRGLPFLQGNADFGPRYPEPVTYCESPKKVALPGDWLLSVRAPVGALNLADAKFGIGRGLCAIRPRIGSFHRDFAGYALAEAVDALRSVATGSTYDAVSTQDVGNLRIAFDSFQRQVEVADFLDKETAKADARTAKYERLIELLEEKRIALITQSVTKGLNPNAPMKDSGVEWVGRVPAHWRSVPLKRLALIDNSGCYGEEPEEQCVVSPVATTAQIDPHGKFNVDAMPLRGFSEREYERYQCNPGDVLVVKSSGSGSSIISGKAGLVTTDTPKFVFSNFLLRLRPKQTEVDPEFLYRFLTSYVTKQRIERMCSTTTYPNLRVSEYSSAIIPLPPLREQRAIARTLAQNIQSFDIVSGKCLDAIRLTREWRLALITAAVNGEIDVCASKTKRVQVPA